MVHTHLAKWWFQSIRLRSCSAPPGSRLNSPVFARPGLAGPRLLCPPVFDLRVCGILFLRCIRDIELSSEKAAGKQLYRATLHTCFIFSLNRKPFNSGEWFNKKVCDLPGTYLGLVPGPSQLGIESTPPDADQHISNRHSPMSPIINKISWRMI